MFKPSFYQQSPAVQTTLAAKIALWISVPLGTIAAIVISICIRLSHLLKTLATNARLHRRNSEPRLTIDAVEHGIFPLDLTLKSAAKPPNKQYNPFA